MNLTFRPEAIPLPPGFGVRRSSAAFECPSLSKAPADWRTQRPPAVRTFLRAWLVVALALWLSPIPSRAVAPRLVNILPAGAQRGTEAQVVFSGQRLEDAQEVLMYEKGLTVSKLEASTNQVKVLLQIAPDCPLGEHQLRLRTDTGISELRTFWIGALTNLAEIEPNTDRSKPQRLPLNCTVHGSLPAEDLDYFVVAAEQGARVSVEIEGIRLGRGALDPFIAIRDAAGHELAASDDTALGFQDGFISILAPATGDYFIEVREAGYGGLEGYYYRLNVGTFPRPAAVYPNAIQAGQQARVRFIGDARGEFEQDVAAPATPREKHGIFAVNAPTVTNGAAGSPAAGAATAPTPNWVRVVPHPVTLEAEPNNHRDQAGPAREIPAVFSGIVSQAGDQDMFRFRAHKGQNLQLGIFARRLRSPLDSFLQVLNPKGAVVVDSDDAGGPDSALTLKPEDDGEYVAVVRDHLHRGGPDFVYALEIVPVESSLQCKFPEVARNDTQSRQYVAVPRGNHFAVLASVRRTGAAGELSLKADGLPAGLRLVTESIPAKVDQFPLVFAASADANLAGQLAELRVTATNGVTGRFQNEIELVSGPNNTSYCNTRVDRLAAAVTAVAPFRVHIVTPSVPLVQSGTMDLQVVAEREPGFDAPINVQLLWRPPGLSALPDMTIPKGSNRVAYVLNAKGDADAQAWPLVVMASAKVNDGDLFVSSPPARLDVGEPYVAATIEKTGCEPGQSTNIVVKLEQKIPFDGPAIIRLMGLSEKIGVPEKQITSADREVVFPVKVDPTCPPGSQRNLFCAVIVPAKGTVIPHNVGQGGSFRVIPPRNLPTSNASKKVASR